MIIPFYAILVTVLTGLSIYYAYFNWEVLQTNTSLLTLITAVLASLYGGVIGGLGSYYGGISGAKRNALFIEDLEKKRGVKALIAQLNYTHDIMTEWLPTLEDNKDYKFIDFIYDKSWPIHLSFYNDKLSNDQISMITTWFHMFDIVNSLKDHNDYVKGGKIKSVFNSPFIDKNDNSTGKTTIQEMGEVFKSLPN
ncbi:hypothetical protein [Alkalihalobacillus sp. CinArs1]|uniref:hypothetical protein n=1 Tax=Alkalihalobacillus sp. CinArs1 TaxID=2995314 RepID=UPI0022DD3D4A|nr:hypothetical protein [Alkalihalobacillus sp. CinArs1]